MTSIVSPTIVFAAVLAFAAAGSRAADQSPSSKVEAGPILRQMSARLGSARQFSFHAHRVAQGLVLPGHTFPEDAQIAVTVRRPNGILAKSTSKEDARDFYFNGRTLTLFDAGKKFYSVAPMRTTIDGLLAQIEAKYGFTPPLGELLVSNIYKSIGEKAQSISYLGRSRTPGFGGVECDRVQLLGKRADAEVWVGVNDRLPRKLEVTFKRRAGQPKLTAELSDWNLAANAGDADFVFHPPQGALKIPMKTTAEIKAEMSRPAHKKGKTGPQT
jgi:hypothetical protein